MSIELKIYEGRIRCPERFKELKEIIEGSMDKEYRKCLLIYDEAKLRIDDNENIQIPFIRRYFSGYSVGKHQMDVLYSQKNSQDITFLVQCLSTEKPFWFVLFTEHFIHSTAEILRDQLKYCIDNLILLGLELENIVAGKLVSPADFRKPTYYQ
jgi:hypothetical protein